MRYVRLSGAHGIRAIESDVVRCTSNLLHLVFKYLVSDCFVPCHRPGDVAQLSFVEVRQWVLSTDIRVYGLCRASIVNGLPLRPQLSRND